MTKAMLRWILGGGCMLAAAAAVACGASANAPGDTGSEDGGKLPIYDAGNGTGYGDDGGEGEGGQTCTDLESPDNCGTCGNVCPGLDASAAIVTCGNGDGGTPACAFACSGENYDVNG